jgi:hypothetical protein
MTLTAAPLVPTDSLPLLVELERARAALDDAERAERLGEGAPELLEVRALRAANGVIAARLALQRLRGEALTAAERNRLLADRVVLALPPRGTTGALRA